ncbi:hypothetical protein MSG28_015255 [Choristoneura fumiferana]|uniref:Uncharacterized protein n=1 Tax=Choristoneura fumiferana TaxID=7141 RepID=A0ACC0KZW8_CHOFU|nr:hypothetical protein MSG28_015255 [Choristoneura fumiferana]
MKRSELALWWLLALLVQVSPAAAAPLLPQPGATGCASHKATLRRPKSPSHADASSTSKSTRIYDLKRLSQGGTRSPARGLRPGARSRSRHETNDEAAPTKCEAVTWSAGGERSRVRQEEAGLPAAALPRRLQAQVLVTPRPAPRAPAAPAEARAPSATRACGLLRALLWLLLVLSAAACKTKTVCRPPPGAPPGCGGRKPPPRKCNGRWPVVKPRGWNSLEDALSDITSHIPKATSFEYKSCTSDPRPAGPRSGGPG